MRVLLTGATGLVGFCLVHTLPSSFQIAGTHERRHVDLPVRPNVTYLPMNLADPQRVRAIVEQVRPEVVIHAASIGSPDQSEHQRDHTWSINVDGTRHLLEACRPYDPYVVLCSSMYVFDGASPPYSEDAPARPVNFYGSTKLMAEQAALELCPRLLIFRFAPLYGWPLPGQRHNWVTWLIDRLSRGQPVSVVDDVWSNNLWVGAATTAIQRAILRRACGVIHAGGRDPMNRYEFSQHIARIFELDAGLLTPVPSATFDHLAQRPANTCCSIARMVEILGVTPPSTEEALITMRQQRPDWWKAHEPAEQLALPDARPLFDAR